jgi:hypothetical protein
MVIEITYNNNLDWRELGKGTIYALIMFLGGVAIISIRGYPWIYIIITIPISFLVFLITALWSELWTRPRKVEINDEGVVLHLRLGRGKKTVRWSDISSLAILLENPEKYDWKKGRDGFLWVGKKKVYTLYWPIAKDLREVYLQKMGRYPPLTWKS